MLVCPWECMADSFYGILYSIEGNGNKIFPGVCTSIGAVDALPLPLPRRKTGSIFFLKLLTLLQGGPAAVGN